MTIKTQNIFTLNLNSENYYMYVLYLGLTLFLIASMTDVITTYIGLTTNLSEQTEFVNYLWVNYGLMGLIASKFISLILLTCLFTPFYIIDRELSIKFLSSLYLMGFFYFGYASIHNIFLLY